MAQYQRGIAETDRRDPVWQLLTDKSVSRRKKAVAGFVLLLFLVQVLLTVSSSRSDDVDIVIDNRTSYQIGVTHTGIWDSNRDGPRQLYAEGTIDRDDPVLVETVPARTKVAAQFNTCCLVTQGPEDGVHRFDIAGLPEPKVIELTWQQLMDSEFVVVVEE